MSDQSASAQEKSHEATPQKLERARKKGELDRSTDAQTALVYLGLASALFVGGSWSAVHLGETLMAFLARPAALAALLTSPASEAIFGELMVRVMGGVLPVLMVPGGFVLALLATRRAIVLAPDKLKPKLSRLSPVANAKQKYGPQGLFEFFKNALKLTTIGVALGLVLAREVDNLPSYVHLDERLLPALLSKQLWSILSAVLVIATAIGLIDIFWQRHRHMKRMRMSHQELKDETKNSEGDPQMRASRRQRAREIAENRMLNDVPNASVIITNPTHYAVALSWTRAAGTVPMCLAKGVDDVAQRIRVRAEQAGVPIHEDAPTARSVYALVEIGQPVKPEHYKAVAAAIVFADKLRAKNKERVT